MGLRLSMPLHRKRYVYFWLMRAALERHYRKAEESTLPVSTHKKRSRYPLTIVQLRLLVVNSTRVMVICCKFWLWLGI